MKLLEDNVYDQPGYLMWRAHQTAWRAFTEHTRSLSITPIQYAILVAVWDFPSIDATRIADLLLFEKTTINDIVQRLENKGLVTRSTSQADKRVKSIYITDAGREIASLANDLRSPIADSLLSPLTSRERATLLQLLRKLVDIDGVVASTMLYAREMRSRVAPVGDDRSDERVVPGRT